MKMNDMILVSVDDHLCEPPHMFDEYLADRWRDEAPKLLHTDDGSDVWTFNGAIIPNVGLNAVAGRPKEEYGIEPTSFEEIRPGCYDIDERIKDMDAGGVLGSMCFPSFPGLPVGYLPTTPTRNSRLPSSGPTTTGTSTNGVVPIRGGSSPWPCR